MQQYFRAAVRPHRPFVIRAEIAALPLRRSDFGRVFMGVLLMCLKVEFDCPCHGRSFRSRCLYVDLESGTLSVDKAVKKDRTVGLPKSDSGIRTVPIPANLLDRMRSMAGDPLALVCPKQSGGYHTKSSLRKLWDRTTAAMIRFQRPDEGPGPKILLKTETDPPRLYDLRHTYCTNLEKKGVPINIACRLMGHSDISVTSKIYTHASDAALEMARRLIDGIPERESDGKVAL